MTNYCHICNADHTYGEEPDGLHAYNEFHVLPSLVQGDLMVSWVDLGEGYCGDWNPEDPEDESLLRFDVMYRDGDTWESVDDGSYCTLVPVETPGETQGELLRLIMDLAQDNIRVIDEDDGTKTIEVARRALEEASWISPDWLTSREIS